MLYVNKCDRYRLIAVALMTCALLIAGLWPFRFFTINHAAYDRAGGCLSCDKFTSAYFPVRLEGGRRAAVSSVAVEARISFKTRSSYPYYARILAFFDTSANAEAIAIGQWKRDLVVRVRKRENETGLPIVAEQDVDSFFTGCGNGALSVRIDRAMVTVFAGRRVMEFRRPVLPDAGIMVVGNSPWGDSPWNGEMCLRREGPLRAATDSFSTIGGAAPALIIPRYFHPVKMVILKPLWEDFSMRNWYTRDIVLNFVGFMPFGYLLTVLLLRRFRVSALMSALIAAGIGLSISLMIELLQVFLPYRSSQMSDVVFNTLGTAFGAILYFVWKSFRYRFTTGTT